MTDRMHQVLDALARLEERGKRTASANEIAQEAGFDRGQRSYYQTARDGRAMAPAQRVIFALTALRKRDLVTFGRRLDGLSGTAYRLTSAGREARRE